MATAATTVARRAVATWQRRAVAMRATAAMTAAVAGASALSCDEQQVRRYARYFGTGRV